MTTKAETQLARAIREALSAMGITAWREQAGQVRVRRGYMHLAPEGTPDIVGHMPDGRALYLEVKCGKGKERPAQTAFLAAARDAGCVCGTVRSVAEAVALVQNARKGAAAA